MDIYQLLIQSACNVLKAEPNLPSLVDGILFTHGIHPAPGTPDVSGLWSWDTLSLCRPLGTLCSDNNNPPPIRGHYIQDT